MKTLEDLIREDSPLLDGLSIVHKINSDISFHISTAKKNPELYSIHKYYSNREITGFKLLKSLEVVAVENGRVKTTRRGVPVDMCLNRPEKYQPIYSKNIKF